ncbi:MAG: hypothetical protein ACI4WG_05310 [Erysipelotrichaceae bacterium]
MNRAQRRKSGVVTKNPVYTLNVSQIKKIKDDAANEAMIKAFILMMGLSLNALRDEFDWGAVRLSRFSDKVLDLLDSLNKGYITFDDCLNMIKKETGIDFIKAAGEKGVII